MVLLQWRAEQTWCSETDVMRARNVRPACKWNYGRWDGMAVLPPLLSPAELTLRRTTPHFTCTLLCTQGHNMGLSIRQCGAPSAAGPHFDCGSRLQPGRLAHPEPL